MKKNLFALAFAFAAVSSQATVLYSTGFEDPEFLNGSSVVFSGGWSPWGFTPNDAGTIQTSVVSSGSQAAKYAKLVGGSGAYDFGGFVAGSIRSINTVATAAEPVFRLTWDMRVDSTTATASEFWGMGDFLSQDTGRFAFGLDKSNNVVVGDQLNSMTVTGASAGRDVWNNFRVDYNAFTKATSYYVNDTLVHQNVVDFGNDLAWVGMVSWSSTNNASDVAYYDNVSVEAVPEPASLAALGIGAAALLRRRKR